MKKCAILLSALLFLTAAGCSGAPQESGENKIYVDQVTLAPTEQEIPEAAAGSTAGSQPPVTEPATSAPETEQADDDAENTAAADGEESQSAEETGAETIVSADALLGTWQFVDGYGFRFLEDGAAEIIYNYSGVVYFRDEELYYQGVGYPMNVGTYQITAENGAETILRLSSEESIGADSLNGRYKLETCTIRNDLAPAQSDYYAEIGPTYFWLIAPISYSTADDMLTLVQDGSEIAMRYYLDDAGLHLVDESGMEDLLTRLN